MGIVHIGERHIQRFDGGSAYRGEAHTEI